MSAADPVQRIAERLVRASCRRLPADERGDRCQEWTAELPAILGDASIRPQFLRTLRTLAFCAGVCWATRRLSGPTRAGSRRVASAYWRTGALPPPNDVARRVARAVVVWLVVVAGLITVLVRWPDPRGSLLVVAALAICFEACCLTDIARAADVRYLSRSKWALVCVIQIPLGGILYLSIGRVRPGRPLHPDAPAGRAT